MKKHTVVPVAKPFSKINYFILAVIFIIPLIWTQYLNANYYSAKFFLVYFISSFSLLASSREWTLPKMPKLLGISLVILATMHLLSPALSGNWVHILYMFKFLSFVFLAYYFYFLKIDLQEFVKRQQGIIFLIAALILVFIINDFYIFRIEKSDIASGVLLGSFGNVNMLAEFLVLSLPLLHLWVKTPARIPDYLKQIILWTWFFFMIYCRSRSVWIGLGLWFIWGLSHKKIGWKEIASVLVAIVVYHASLYTSHLPSNAGAAKGESIGQRMHLYLSTLELIKDHPLGVGVGQYGNEIIPYLVNSEFKPLEGGYFDQPHSEFLKWGAEFGWLGLILPAFILILLAIACWRAKNFFLTSSLVVLLPQMAFQFPFENPASLLYLSFLFALVLGLFPIWFREPVELKQRISIFILALVGITHSVLFVGSIFLETRHDNDLDLIIGACKYYPVNINACYNRDQHLINAQRLPEAREALIEDLEKFPFQAGFMRLHAIYLQNQPDARKVCEALWVYEYVFDKTTFVSPENKQACRAFKNPVEHHSPEQFKRDYLDWLHKSLQ
jgi:hypothetical protein